MAGRHSGRTYCGSGRELLTNAPVLDVMRAGRSFKPVEGDSGIHAAPVFLREEADGSVLVAAFNYSEDETTPWRVELTRLGLDAGRTYSATDLWSGAEMNVSGILELTLGPAQSKLLRLRAK